MCLFLRVRCAFFSLVHSELGAAISSQTEESGERAQSVGLYVRALCVGLEAELVAYRSSLLGIEQEILLENGRNGNYPLSRMHFHISPYLVLLSPLVSIVEEIDASSDGTGVTQLFFPQV